jgi:hypothetical protein
VFFFEFDLLFEKCLEWKFIQISGMLDIKPCMFLLQIFLNVYNSNGGAGLNFIVDNLLDIVGKAGFEDPLSSIPLTSEKI